MNKIWLIAAIFFVLCVQTLAETASECEARINAKMAEIHALNKPDGDGNVFSYYYGCSQCADAYDKCKKDLDARWSACVTASGAGNTCSEQMEAAYYGCDDTEIDCCKPFVIQEECAGLPATEAVKEVEKKEAVIVSKDDCQDSGDYWVGGSCKRRNDANKYCQSVISGSHVEYNDGISDCKCDDGYTNINGKCTVEKQESKDPCLNVKCDGKCETPTGRTGRQNDYQKAVSPGICNPNTGECEYEPGVNCAAGCEVRQVSSKGQSYKSGVCKEECDDSNDNDGDSLVDCDDSDCSKSLYCSCQTIGSTSGTDFKVRLIYAGYNYETPTFLLTSEERDKQTRDDAESILNSLKKTDPFNKFGFEVKVTRMPMWFGTTPWRGDAIAKCKGGDTVVFSNYYSTSQSNAKLMSQTAYMNKKTVLTDMGTTVLHELGHAMGGLWDEYTISEDFGNIIGGFAKVRDFGFSARANCALGYGTLTTEAQCTEYFTQFRVSYKCVKGCSSGEWYRSSDNSIMLDQNQYSDFNEVSKKILSQRIQNLINPYYMKPKLWMPPKRPGEVKETRGAE